MYVRTYVRTYYNVMSQRICVRTYVRTSYNVMSQLSDWKGTHVRWEPRIHKYVVPLVMLFVRTHVRTMVRTTGTHVCMYVRTVPWWRYVTHVHWEPRVFWEDTRQPVERGSECRAIHTYTLPLVEYRTMVRTRIPSLLTTLTSCTCWYGHSRNKWLCFYHTSMEWCSRYH
jgi:hypothetical protein